MLDINAERVSYEYPNGFRALNQISLSIDEGKFVVIMGPNGAGKSTLCLTFNGIIPHSIGGTFYGSVHLGDLDTMKHEIYELAQYVGLVMQNPEAQLLCSTVEDELAFGPENLCLTVDQIRERILKTAKAIRVEELLNRGPTDLSGGQVQRVVTAAMLTMEPRVMVFDEATSALDPRGAIDLFQLARQLNQERKMTVIMTEHKSEQIAEFADCIVILNKGEVVKVGTPREVFSQVENLKAINVAPPQVTRLMHQLGFPADQLPITLGEAEQMLRPRLQGRPESARLDGNRFEQGNGNSHAQEPIIQVHDLAFFYPGPVQALRGVSLTVNKGDFLGIIGENGAGKSTLVKMFVGLLKPTAGEVRVFGRNVNDQTTSTLARRIGLVLQNPDHQLFKPSVIEEVRVGPLRFGLTPTQVEERTQEALDLVGIADMAGRHPLSLSWGDRQKVALASILAMKPEVIIFDEPTTGQDLAGRTTFMELAKHLNEEGFSVIVITHDMELVTRYAKRCIVMGGGQVLMDDTTRKVFRHPEILQQTFVQVPQIVQLGHLLADCGVPQDILTVEEMAGVLRERGVKP